MHSYIGAKNHYVLKVLYILAHLVSIRFVDNSIFLAIFLGFFKQNYRQAIISKTGLKVNLDLEVDGYTSEYLLQRLSPVLFTSPVLTKACSSL